MASVASPSCILGEAAHESHGRRSLFSVGTPAISGSSQAVQLMTTTTIVQPAIMQPLPVGGSGSFEAPPRQVPLYLRGAGVLRVHVRRATQLAVTNSKGKSDPFVAISLGPSATRRTKVKPNTLEPTWDERHDFQVESLEQALILPLKLEVFSGSSAKKRTSLGHAQIDLSPLLGWCPHELPDLSAARAHLPAAQLGRAYRTDDRAQHEYTVSEQGELLFEGLTIEHDELPLHYENSRGQGYVWLRVQLIPAELASGTVAELAAATKELGDDLKRRRPLTFDAAGDSSLVEIASAWSVRHSREAVTRENMEVLGTVARVMGAHRAISCRIHCETDTVEYAPRRLADEFGLHPSLDVAEIMDGLAERRAHACLEALVALGVPERRLYATHRGQGNGAMTRFALQLEPPPPRPSGSVVRTSADARRADEVSHIDTRMAQIIRTSADELGIGVGVLAPSGSAPVLQDARLSHVWVVVDALGLFERAELTTSSLANPQPRAAAPLDFGFYRAFEVPPDELEASPLPP